MLTSFQAQFDKLKRKALFAPAAGNENNPAMTNVVSNPVEDQRPRPKAPSSVPNARDVSLVETNRVSYKSITETLCDTNCILIIASKNSSRLSHKRRRFS